jgi:hypothetical protein
MSRTVFFAYAVVTMDEVILFIDSAQLDDTARQNLDHVYTKPYHYIFEHLNGISRTLELGKESVRSFSPSLNLQPHYHHHFSRKSCWETEQAWQ